MKKQKTLFTSNYSNAKIEMYDGSAKRSKHHGSANQDPADHNHRSAAIAVDKYAADRSCTEGRKISLFLGAPSFAEGLQH